MKRFIVVLAVVLGLSASAFAQISHKNESGWSFRWGSTITDSAATAWIVAIDSTHGDSIRAEFFMGLSQDGPTMDYIVDLMYFGWKDDSTIILLFKEKSNAGGVTIFVDGKELKPSLLWVAAHQLRIIFGEDIPVGESGHINSFNFEQIFYPFRSKK